MYIHFTHTNTMESAPIIIFLIQNIINILDHISVTPASIICLMLALRYQVNYLSKA